MRTVLRPVEPVYVSEETFLAWHISELGLSLRIQNTLESSGIETVRELMFKEPGFLQDIPNLGEVSLKKIQRVVKAKYETTVR